MTYKLILSGRGIRGVKLGQPGGAETVLGPVRQEGDQREARRRGSARIGGTALPLLAAEVAFAYRLEAT